MGIIDHESDDGARVADATSDDGSLLAAAVEHKLNPPTDPRGHAWGREARGESERPNDTQIRFRCGACMEIVKVERRFAGRRGQCPRCLCEFTIPILGQRTPKSGDAPPQATPISRALGGPPSTKAASPRSRTRRRTRSERRRSSRFNVKDAVVRWSEAGYPDGRTYLKAHTLEDLSLTGLRFIGQSLDIEIGTVCYFAVDFPAFPLPVRFKGEIRRVIALEREEGFSAGIRFLEYADDAESKIRRLLDDQALRDVRRR